MLKQISYIFISTLILVSTIGFSVSKHYCNNEFVSYSIDAPASSCCEGCSNHCCHNEDQLIVLKVNFLMPEVAVNNISELVLFAIKHVENPTELIENHLIDDIEINLKLPLGVHLFLSKIQSYLL